MIERGIPDLIDTEHLPTVLAAEIDFLAGRFERWTERGGPMVRARAWVGLGGRTQAEDLVSTIDARNLDRNELIAAAWAVSRIGPKPAAQTILEVLHREDAFLMAGDVPLGPRSLAEGPLFASIGDLATAEARLDEAVVSGDARAPLWGALARVELARIKMSVVAAGDTDAADAAESIDRLLGSAALFLRAGGYRSMLSRVDEMAAPSEPPAPGSPTVGRLLPGRPWSIGFGVVCDVPVRASKGLVALRHMVQNPGRPIPAIEIDRVVNGGAPVPMAAMMAKLETADGDGLDQEIRALLLDDTVRSRVGKLLTRAVHRLEDQQPLLGRHLRISLRTGHICTYDPPTGSSVIWVA